MKIAFIIPSLANRGPVVFTKYLIQGLLVSVDHIDVFYFDDVIELDLGVPSKKINFFDVVDFSCYDIVHSTMLKPDLYLWWHEKRIKNKSVISLHNYVKEDLGLLYSPIRAYLYARMWMIALNSVKRLIVSSANQKNYYSKLLSSNNIYSIIPYGISRKELMEIEETEFSLLTSLKNRYTVIGSCGLLIRRKGFFQLLEFLRLNESYALILIGDGDQRLELEAKVAEYGLGKRCVFLGFKSNSIDYYRFFDIYAMTSYSEGFGLAMLEALTHGIPLVCANLPIYDEFFTNSDVCLFELDNLSSLTLAIQRASGNKVEFSERSARLFEEHFSLSVMAKEHLKLYRSIIKG